MKNMETTATPIVNPVTVATVETSVNYAADLSYHEMADVPVTRVSQIEQLRANIAQLEDMSARIKFMTKEIRYLMKV